VSLLAIVNAQQPYTQVATFEAASVGMDMIRVLQLNYSPRAVEFTGIAANANQMGVTVDAVQFNFTTLNQTTLSFGFLHESNQQGGGGQQAVVINLLFILRAVAIVEFLDTDGVPGFQPNNNNSNHDTPISFYDLSHPLLPWKPIVINSTMIQGPNGPFKVSYVEATTADDVFFIRFVVTESPVKVGNVTISTSKSKIDFAINYYNPNHGTAPWSTGISPAGTYPNAKIGLIGVSVSGEAFAAFDNRTTNNGGASSASVTFGTGYSVGNFSWNPNAQVSVTGTQAAVYAFVTEQTVSGMSNTTSNVILGQGVSFRFLVFSFEAYRPPLVYWDPVFGADINYAAINSQSQGSSQAGTQTAPTTTTHVASAAALAYSLAAILLFLMI